MNKWQGVGSVKSVNRGKGASGQSYAIVSMVPDGDAIHITVAVWGDLAEGLGGLGVGDRVKVVGKIGARKDKKQSEKAGFDIWPQQINVDAEKGGSITHDGGGGAGAAARSAPEDDLAF